jgi:hypothetical protein
MCDRTDNHVFEMFCSSAKTPICKTLPISEPALSRISVYLLSDYSCQSVMQSEFWRVVWSIPCFASDFSSVGNVEFAWLHMLTEITSHFESPRGICRLTSAVLNMVNIVGSSISIRCCFLLRQREMTVLLWRLQIDWNTSASVGNESRATSLRINAVLFYGEISDLDME